MECVGTGDQREAHREGPHTCGSCQLLLVCLGCLQAGYAGLSTVSIACLLSAHKEKGRKLSMAHTRSNQRGKEPPRTNSQGNRRSQQRKVQRLFQSNMLTALFGRSVSTLVTRIILTLVTVGV